MRQFVNKLKIPHTFVLIFSIGAIVAAATWIIPAGEFDTVKNAQGKPIVVAGTYHSVDAKPQGIFDLLLAPAKGFIDAVEIAIFILIIGGAFKVFSKSGAIEAAIIKTAHKLRGREILTIPALMILFSLGGAVFGMSEEIIPFIAIFVPFALALGYDSIVGIAIPFVGAGLGFAGAMLNPFTVGIAQGIAGLKPFSGVGYRTICWAAITLVGIAFVMLYARKIKKNPATSPVYEIDLQKKKELTKIHADDVHFTTTHKLVIATGIAGIALLIFGVLKWGWYIQELCALFIGLGIVCGIVARLGANTTARYFAEGARDLCDTAILVGLARAITVIAQDGRIIDTVLQYLAFLVQDVPHMISVWLMFLIQTVINFFVPSGSGQAALTIPIMAPLGDLLGIKRQVTVLAYQFGDGFTNLIIPTSYVLLGCLAMAKVPWSSWARWILPLQIVFVVIGCALLSLAVGINFGA